MAVIYDITSISVGTATEDFNVSNSGWTKNTSSGAYGTGSILVTNANGTPTSAYTTTATTAGYLYNTAPGSIVQTVKARIHRYPSISNAHIIQLFARATSGGDDYVSCQYQADNRTLLLVKCVNGTRSALGSAVTVTGMTNIGDETVIELRVSGTSPTISVSMWQDGTQLGSTQTVTDSQLDGIGLVGFAYRNNSPTETTGVHITELYAEDDTAGGETLTAEHGTITFIGQSVAYKLSSELASTVVTFVGQDVSFTYQQPGVYNVELDPGIITFSAPESYSNTGTLLETATLSFTGSNLNLRWSGDAVVDAGKIRTGVGIGVGIAF